MTVPESDSTTTVWCYSVAAAAEAGVMPRVVELFAKRGLVPSRLLAVVSGPRAETLDIDLQVSGMADDTADHVAESLRQLVHVERVLTAVRHGCEHDAAPHEVRR